MSNNERREDRTTDRQTVARCAARRRCAEESGPESHGHALAWLLLLGGLGGFFADRIGALLDFAWTQLDLSSPMHCETWRRRAKTFALLTILPLGTVALCGVLADFLQVGAMFAPKRIMPQGSRLNPATGFKRMFSLENLFELAKSLLKTLMLAAVLVLVDQSTTSRTSCGCPPRGCVRRLDRRLMLMLGAWIVVLFAFVSIADRLFQNYSHRKPAAHEQAGRETRAQGRSRRSAAARATQATAPAMVAPGCTSGGAQCHGAGRQPNAHRHRHSLRARTDRRADHHCERRRPSCTDDAQGSGGSRRPDHSRRAAGTRANFRAEEDDFIPEEFFDAVAEVLAWAERQRATGASGQP